MKRSVERAVPCSGPDDSDSLLSWQKHRLLQARDEGNLAEQRRHDLKQQKSQLLRRLVEELRAEWLEAPDQLVRALEGLYLAFLLGGRGGRTLDDAPGPEGPAQRAAPGPRRAGEKHKAREEKSRREEPARPQPWCPKSQRRAGQSHSPPVPSPPEKRKGRRGPATKTGSRRSGGPLAAVGETQSLEGRGQLSKGAAGLIRGPSSGSAAPRRRRGRLRDLEQLWPSGPTPRRRAPQPAAPCRRGDQGRWQRELESAFKELFDTNRKLQRHLSLHLDLRPGQAQSPQEEEDSETPDPGGEALGETTSEAEMERPPAREPASPAEADGHHAASSTTLKRLLSKLQHQNHPQGPKPTLRSESPPPPAQAGVFPGEGGPLFCSSEARQQLSRPNLQPEGSLQRPLLEQLDRVDMLASGQKQKTELEQRWWKQLDSLEHTEHPRVSLGAPHPPEQARGEQVGAYLARLRACSSRSLGESEGVRGSSSPSTTSIVDDDRHSQILHKLQQQILEQNRLHKQFLEEARKRLQEFQRP